MTWVEPVVRYAAVSGLRESAMLFRSMASWLTQMLGAERLSPRV